MITLAFEQFIAPARRYPAIWRILLGILTGLIVYIVLALLLVLAGNAVLGLSSPLLIFETISVPDSPAKMAILMLTFVGMWAGAWVAALWHWRGLRSLIGPIGAVKKSWFKAVAIAGVGLVTGGLIVSLLMPTELLQVQVLSVWALNLVWAVPLLFIQTAGEELIFRGYLQQQLAARFRHSIVWMILPSILFGLAHYNAELDQSTALLIVCATGLFGLVAADITRVTGNLGAAMGFHFVNNFLALMLIGIDDSLSGLALYHTDFSMKDTEIVQPLLIADMVIICAVWYVLRRGFRS